MSRAALLLLVACHAQDATSISNATSTTRARANEILVVCLGSSNRAEWPAHTYEGALFELVRPAGYLATVRIGNDAIDCDDCAGVSTSVTIVDGTPKPGCFIAFGPVDQPLRDARTTHTGRSELTSAWATTDQIDVADRHLERVVRCAHSVRSGCRGTVCDRTCIATTVNRGAPQGTICRSFVPDVADCTP